MLITRTYISAKMNGAQRWLLAALLHVLLLMADSAKHHRRSMPTQLAFPSKGGWRPVVGSGSFLYGGQFGTAPLHSQSYKIPVPVMDLYPSSSRPVVARDATKLTSIAQSYRPTTLRSILSSASPSVNPMNQPINSYHNPFALPNNPNGPNHYKFIQNFPVESVVIRNPHNPYAAHPVYPKYQQKFKQPLQNNVFQQLSQNQPIQFGQYQTSKPGDFFGKPLNFGWPNDIVKKPQSGGTEIYKPEVYKLPDSDTAQQSVSQQVKTAQQQSIVVTPKSPNVSPYPQYFQDPILPPSILGSFGSFSLHSGKGNPYYTPKTTYVPQQPTKQTIFNSYNYSPFKVTPTQYISTTPKVQTTVNHLNYGTILTDNKQQTKSPEPQKIDPNAGAKVSFKASPQDPFAKPFAGNNKIAVTTYNPTVQTTTLPNNYFTNNFNIPLQQNTQALQFYPHLNPYYNDNTKKMKIHHDSFAAGHNQKTSEQYVKPSLAHLEATQSLTPVSTYEVTEAYESDFVTRPSSNAYPTSDSQDTIHNSDQVYNNPTTTPIPDIVEEYAIVTEGDQGYENSLTLEKDFENQSRRPLGDDFEPIGKQKLKDYYYRVSTPAYEKHGTRRTKKPKPTPAPEVSTSHSDIKDSNDVPVEALPTLAPNQHFKRPSTPEPLDRDRIRKRNKIRRRRPIGGINRDKESNKENVEASTEPTIPVEEETHTIKPRIRPSKPNQQPNVTAPTVTTDLTTSALPTVSPTIPTIVKKKLGHRRPITTTPSNIENTTPGFRVYEANDSPIMKIATRLASTRFPQETPDYTHKQDEKDTPTSDIAVSLTDSLSSTTKDAELFSFHRDTKPVEIIEETTTQLPVRDTTEFVSEITTTSRSITGPGKLLRPKLRPKYRPRFSVKDYRNRLSSTTSTTEKPEENTPKVRFPHRRVPYSENNETENVTERKKFTPKESRYKPNRTEEKSEDQIENDTQAPRYTVRQRPTTADVNTDSTTQKISSRIRNGTRRPRPTTNEETTETLSPTTSHTRRPLRKKVKDPEIGESVQDISVTDTTLNYDHRFDMTSERTRSESAIMKIADKKHHDPIEHLFEHSKRVSDLTLAASKDYNTPGMFKTVPSNSRRIPNYFTIATDDPILPIEAFFPQLNQKKEA